MNFAHGTQWKLGKFQLLTCIMNEATQIIHTARLLFGDKEKCYFKIGTAKDKFRLPQLWPGSNTKAMSGEYDLLKQLARQICATVRET